MQTADSADTLPKRLAKFINQGGGSYPLVTLLERDKKLVVLWQYEKQDIIVRCVPDLCNGSQAPRLVLEEPVELEVSSAVAAFELIRHTEYIRQNNADHPYLQFGPMPGTRLDSKLLFHLF